MSRKNTLIETFNQLSKQIQEEITRVESEKQDWEKQKALMKKYDFDSDIVHLNVGGVIYTTTRSTLTQRIPFEDSEHFLSAMMSGRFPLLEDNQKRIFIDRDGTHFRYILNYLRSAGQLENFVLPSDKQIRQELAVEAMYYNFRGLAKIFKYGGVPEIYYKNQRVFDVNFQHRKDRIEVTKNTVVRKNKDPGQWEIVISEKPLCLDPEKLKGIEKLWNYWEVTIENNTRAPNIYLGFARKSQIPGSSGYYISQFAHSVGTLTLNYAASGARIGFWVNASNRRVMVFLNDQPYTTLSSLSKEKDWHFAVSLSQVNDKITLSQSAMHPDICK